MVGCVLIDADAININDCRVFVLAIFLVLASCARAPAPAILGDDPKLYLINCTQAWFIWPKPAENLPGIYSVVIQTDQGDVILDEYVFHALGNVHMFIYAHGGGVIESGIILRAGTGASYKINGLPARLPSCVYLPLIRK